MFAALRAIGRILSKASQAARRSAQRGARARSDRGKYRAYSRAGRLTSAEIAELIEEAASLLEEAEAIILAAYVEALTTMGSMVANAGQASVYQSDIIPGFEEAFGQSDPQDGWPDVDVGQYMAFVGEIVEAGNQIMEAAYQDAAQLILDAESILDSLG